MATTTAGTAVHELPAERPDGFWDGVARSYIPPRVLDVDPSLSLDDRVAGEVDPVSAEVIRYALLNTNFEHAELIQRLCVSPVTMLTRDYQASVLTEDGEHNTEAFKGKTIPESAATFVTSTCPSSL